LPERASIGIGVVYREKKKILIVVPCGEEKV